MKIKIRKLDVSIYRVISALEGSGRVASMSPSLVRELMKFQEIAQDIQKLLCAFYEGKFTPEGQLKSVVEKVNDTHNRRPN